MAPVPGTYQRAEIERMASGLRVCSPMQRQASVYRLVITAFMGLPRPKKIATSPFDPVPCAVQIKAGRFAPETARQTARLKYTGVVQ